MLGRYGVMSGTRIRAVMRRVMDSSVGHSSRQGRPRRTCTSSWVSTHLASTSVSVSSTVTTGCPAPSHLVVPHARRIDARITGITDSRASAHGSYSDMENPLPPVIYPKQ